MKTQSWDKLNAITLSLITDKHCGSSDITVCGNGKTALTA